MDGEVRAFAERVLSGVTLADKLDPPGRLADRHPGEPCAVPRDPGRPDALRLGRRRRGLRPSVATVADRGRLLHAFANHELLALELLALALLRFPDAPPRLRRAWLATLADEQRHCRAYLERMAACGVALGEEPVSAYFWDALRDVPDPAGFVAGLSLVLEQANLDFSRHWRDAFAAAGDADTAAVLDAVYEDEIRHVRTGVRWLRRLDDRPDWDAFRAALRFPLTPARARGPVLDREGRRRAGLSAAFVDEIAVAATSKGRLPRVFLFDPHVEDAIAGRSGRSPVARDLAALPILLAGEDDVVVAPRPSTAFLARLASAGFAIPELVPAADPALLPNGRAGPLHPWGWSPATAAALAPLGGRWDPRWAALSDKTWAADRLRELDPRDAGVRCSTLAEVEAAIRGPTLIKARFSTAGGRRVRVEGALDARARAFVARNLPVLVEPWLDVACELSVQLERGRVLGITRFLASNGVYRGTVIGPPDLGLSAELRRFVVPRWGALEAAATHVGRAAAALGYDGPLGVDALVVRGEDGLRLKPIGEVNARYTMGRVALALRDRVSPSCGLWAFLPAGTDVAAIERGWPLVVERGRIRSGALATTNPAGAEALVTVLGVDERWDAAAARWGGILAP